MVTTTTYDAFDEMGRELSVTKSIQGAPASGYTTVTTYDLAGKVTSTTYPDYFRVDYAYHPGTGLIHTITGSPPDSVQYALLESYEPTGKIGHISYGNGTATNYSYDSLSTRLKSIITTGAAEILNKAYTYTPAGDIASIADSQSGVTYSYAYDRLHRLISETNDGSSDNFAQATLISTYDDVNRPLHAPASIIYNWSERYYEDDANGNLTSIPDFSDPFYNSFPRSASNSITYNADNMPIRIENRKNDGGMVSTIAVDFTYDGNGTRAKKADSTGKTTYYIGDHFEVADVEEIKYIFAGNQRIAKVTTGNSYYFHKDHLGSSSVMTDYPAGATVETTGYLPFGHERDHTGADVTDYKFTDQEKDTETGLYNYDARMYDPVIARFISADSIIPSFYDPQSLNRYAYVRNNPLKYVDPTGHDPKYSALHCHINYTQPKETKAAANALLRVSDYIPVAGDIKGTVESGIAIGRNPKSKAAWIGVAATVAGYFGLDFLKAGKHIDNIPAKYDPGFALKQGADATTVVPDSYTVVRGGQSSMPDTGTTFSGSTGSTLSEAASGVPHGSVRATTAGKIRSGGGVVELSPEPTRSGVINTRHANVTEGSSSTFGEITNNPVSKKERIK